MSSKEVTAFITSSLSEIKETLKEHGTSHKEIREMVFEIDKKQVSLSEKIISNDAKHEAHYQELTGKHSELKDRVAEMGKDVNYLTGWVGKAIGIFAFISFVATVLGINGIDLIKKIFKEDKVDNVYADGIQSTSHE